MKIKYMLQKARYTTHHESVMSYSYSGGCPTFFACGQFLDPFGHPTGLFCLSSRTCWHVFTVMVVRFKEREIKYYFCAVKVQMCIKLKVLNSQTADHSLI